MSTAIRELQPGRPLADRHALSHGDDLLHGGLRRYHGHQRERASGGDGADDPRSGDPGLRDQRHRERGEGRSKATVRYGRGRVSICWNRGVVSTIMSAKEPTARRRPPHGDPTVSRPPALCSRKPNPACLLARLALRWSCSTSHAEELNVSAASRSTGSGSIPSSGTLWSLEFRRFVNATGTSTFAERRPIRRRTPGPTPTCSSPGRSSSEDRPTRDPDDYRNWWSSAPGADWRLPEGPGSTLNGRDDTPSPGRLGRRGRLRRVGGQGAPTEAEWEYAARGGLEGKAYVWGDEHVPNGNRGQHLAGRVPLAEPAADCSRAPRRWSLPAQRLRARHGGQRLGVDDRLLRARTRGESAPTCCAPRNPHLAMLRPSLGHETIPRRVTKGGSHLCAPNYCLRYRPAARQGEAVDTSTTHIGFRCTCRPRSSFKRHQGRCDRSTPGQGADRARRYS